MSGSSRTTVCSFSRGPTARPGGVQLGTDLGRDESQRAKEKVEKVTSAGCGREKIQEAERGAAEASRAPFSKWTLTEFHAFGSLSPYLSDLKVSWEVTPRTVPRSLPAQRPWAPHLGGGKSEASACARWGGAGRQPRSKAGRGGLRRVPRGARGSCEVSMGPQGCHRPGWAVSLGASGDSACRVSL